MLDATDDPRGWFLPRSRLLLLREAADTLQVVGADGEVTGELRGAVAAALRRRLTGDRAPSPLLDALLRRDRGLAEALASDRPLPLQPAALLRRGGWGQLFVELTARCNERCRHCYADAGPERTELLARETAVAVVREAGALGFRALQLTGGEALLHPHVEEVAAAARAAGVPTVELYTNGLLLTDARLARLLQHEVAFAFSLYAREPAVHDAVTRVPGSHGLTVAAIRRALASGAAVRVGVVATRPEDEAEAVAAAELARELGVGRVAVEVSRAVGRGEYAGRPAPPVPTSPEDAGGGPHARVHGGKAAVLPDGSVTPCIFSRRLVLGRVGPTGGLREALEGRGLRLRGGRLSAARQALCTAGAGLACADCRIATALLEPARLPTVAQEASA